MLITVFCVRRLQVAQTFYITIKPVDDSLPLLQVPGMRVQEGVRKTITEFELKATDADTEVRHWLHKSLKISTHFCFVSRFKGFYLRAGPPNIVMMVVDRQLSWLN